MWLSMEMMIILQSPSLSPSSVGRSPTHLQGIYRRFLLCESSARNPVYLPSSHFSRGMFIGSRELPDHEMCELPDNNHRISFFGVGVEPPWC